MPLLDPDPRRRAELNDRWQRARAQARRGSSGGTRPPHACWRLRPRPRVTRRPTHWRSESAHATRRHARLDAVGPGKETHR